MGCDGLRLGCHHHLQQLFSSPVVEDLFDRPSWVSPCSERVPEDCWCWFPGNYTGARSISISRVSTLALFAAHSVILFTFDTRIRPGLCYATIASHSEHVIRHTSTHCTQLLSVSLAEFYSLTSQEESHPRIWAEMRVAPSRVSVYLQKKTC